MQIYT